MWGVFLKFIQGRTLVLIASVPGHCLHLTFYELRCNKLYSLKMPRNDHFYFFVSLLYAHYPIFSFYLASSKDMLYLVHKYKKKLESKNMGLTHREF